MGDVGPMTVSPITRVTGGVAGLAATYAEVRALADRFDAAGDHLRDHAAADAHVLAEPDLLESAPLSPVTFADAEARVLDASAGVHGALEASVTYEGDALLVRAMVTAYEESDRLVASSFEALDYAVGRDVGYAVSAAAPSLLLVGLAAGPTWDKLPAGVRRRLGDTAQEWADEHPEAVQHGVDATGGLLDGLLAGMPAVSWLAGFAAFHPTAGDAAADLAALYPNEGRPEVRRRHDLAVPLARVPPRDLTGLIRHLDQVSLLSPPDRPGDAGTIEVQTLDAPDGTVRHIVYLPGTDDLAPAPWEHHGDVRDLSGDLHAIAGEDTTYAAGIEQAMAEAGIGPHDPVLLVGHSLGGLEAASMLAHGSSCDVTHVVTAGSPLGAVHGYPADTHVLSLENRGDLVPLLDGRDNADTTQQVTVQFDDHETSMIGNHDLRHYLHGAAAADASADPSVREQLDSLRAAGFLGSHDPSTGRVFQITR
jgi:hypothetical protein